MEAKESTTGVLLAFFSSVPGWWRILKLASTKPPLPRSSCKQKGWMTSPSNTALFPHHDGRNGIKYNLVGLPSISVLINRNGRVSKAVLASKMMGDLANMMEWGTLGNGPAINNRQPQKGLTPKGHC